MLGSSTAIIAEPGEGGGGGVALTVAANDALTDIKDRADYLCDGTADQVQIQAAHDALPAAGGIIELSAGNFTLSDEIDITKDGVTLAGQGFNYTTLGTRINRNSAGSHYAVNVQASNVLLRNLFIGDTGATATTVELVRWGTAEVFCEMENVMVYNLRTGEGAMVMDSAGLSLTHCYIFGEDAGINVISSGRLQAIDSLIGASTSGFGIRRLISGRVTLRDSAVDGPGGIFQDGVDVTLLAYDSEIAGWDGASAIHADGSDTLQVRLVGCSIDSQDGLHAVNLIGGSTYSRVQVVGNEISSSDQHGIAMTSVNDGQIHDNTFRAVGLAANDTYSNIILLANCDRNSIQGNQCRRASSTPHPKYGIRIDNANCDGNIVYNNDLTNSVAVAGTGAEYSDVGTGTYTGPAAPDSSQIIQIQVSDPNGSDLTTGNGQGYFVIPDMMDTYELTEVLGAVTDVSSTGAVSVQIHNVTQAVDMLTTVITVDQGEPTSLTAAAAVIDASNDDVAAGDIIRIDVDGAGTDTKGLLVSMVFTPVA